MRTDILEFHEFYRTALGVATRDFIRDHLRDAWGDSTGLAIAGFGYANPYLECFGKAERTLALSPGSQGIIRWPTSAKNRACLVGENDWPLPDASLDRVLIVHGLEEASDPHKLMREVWRVLADDGRLIIVTSHRRGLWSMIDSTPFAAGRPYLKRQLNRLLEGAMFRAANWNAALYFPPLKTKLLLRAAKSWERAGARVWPGLSGVLLVEAQKDMLAPAIPVRSAKERALRPAIASPQATSRNANLETPDPDKAG
ncbi:MAG: SAM-dependent methyltransferase [Hyphococcus sp.]|nr:MAG: SAM-dependent methyltransferase [Marinicaulis sp.]